MARRRFVRRRFGTSKFQRKQLTWATTTYLATPIDRSGAANTVTEQVLFDPMSIRNDTNPDPDRNHVVHIKRVIVRGGMFIVPNQAVYEQGGWHVCLAIYSIDRDDTEADIASLSVTNNIMATERVLWFDTHCGQIYEIVAANSQNQHVEPATVRIDVDLKLPVRLRPDQLLVLGYQFMVTATALASFAAATTRARVLYELP